MLTLSSLARTSKYSARLVCSPIFKFILFHSKLMAEWERDDHHLCLPQFGELKRCRAIGVEDRISALPDDLLMQILSWLSLKEVVASSILSRRWRNLWVSHPNLDFGCSYFRSLKPEVFKQAVDTILSKFNGPKSHKFRIVYPLLDYIIGCPIDDWISLAFRNGVSELELNFDFIVRSNYPNKCCFPAHVFAQQEMIYSDHHASLLTTTTSAKKHFEFLRDLRLVSVDLSDQVFVMILSSCSSLEKLCIMFCHSLVNAKNTAPHLKLKSFELYACQALETLVLLAPHLVSFKYYGYERTLCVKDAHQLASLSLGTNIRTDPNDSDILPRGKNFILSQFSWYLPKLESLAVAVHIFRDMSNFAHLPEFTSLKHLAIDVASSAWMQLGYQLVVSILGAAPSLELLEIYLQLPSDRSNLNEQNIQVPNMGSKPPHQSLKEVKVFGFRGDVSMMKFLDYLIKYSVHLQKLDVTARGAIRGFDKLMLQPFLLWSEDDATYCKECVRQLRQALPENAQLLFHEEE